MLNNKIHNNLQYELYLSERVNKNTIQGHTTSGNDGAGVCVKSGGDKIAANSITADDDTISIVRATLYTPATAPVFYDSNHKNVIQGKVIEANSFQLESEMDNETGLTNVAEANLIPTNGTQSISFDAASTKNVVYGNMLGCNAVVGIMIKGLAHRTQFVDGHNITVNEWKGVKVDANANCSLAASAITSEPGSAMVTGTKVAIWAARHRASAPADACRGEWLVARHAAPLAPRDRPCWPARPRTSAGQGAPPGR